MPPLDRARDTLHSRLFYLLLAYFIFCTVERDFTSLRSETPWQLSHNRFCLVFLTIYVESHSGLSCQLSHCGMTEICIILAISRIKFLSLLGCLLWPLQTWYLQKNRTKKSHASVPLGMYHSIVHMSQSCELQQRSSHLNPSLKGQQHEIFYLHFFHGSTLYKAHILRLRQSQFFVLAKLLDFSTIPCCRLQQL